MLASLPPRSPSRTRRRFGALLVATLLLLIPASQAHAYIGPGGLQPGLEQFHGEARRELPPVKVVES
jgi:hypothetical protein